MKYIKVYADFADALALLGDAEQGRLFMAMLRYAQTGTEPDFRGNERFLWPQAKAGIDRCTNTYGNRCAAAAAARAARGREASGAGTETNIKTNIETNMKPECFQHGGALEPFYKRREEKKRETPVAPFDGGGDRPQAGVALREGRQSHRDSERRQGRDPAASERQSCGLHAQHERQSRACELLSDDEARELQEAFDAVLDAARDIGIPQTSADVRKANALVADYSAAWVLEAVARAGTGPASARSWRYVEGILRKWRAAGGMDAEQAKARAAVPDIAEVGFD